jgi:hypothetical protein
VVQPEELKQRLRTRPFQPFQVHVSDGRIYDIRYPEINLVFRAWLCIGIPEPKQDDPVAEHSVMVPLAWIIKLEPLPSPVDSLPA